MAIPKAIRFPNGRSGEGPVAREPIVSAVEAAYAAGIMDGEGCFYVSRRHERTNTNQATHRAWYVASADVTSTTPEMIEWLRARWGGSIYNLKLRPDKRLKSQKQAYQWRLTATALESFLDAVQPYLVVKRDQCRMIRALRAVTVHRGQSQGDERWRQALTDLHERIYQKAIALKRTA